MGNGVNKMLKPDIMEQFRGYFARDGYLNICSMRKKLHDFYDFFSMRAPGGAEMFGKYLEDKTLIDAEVLMSAVYHEMGVKTPIYLPFMERSQMGVICEDVTAHDPTAKTISEIQAETGSKIYRDFYVRNLIRQKDSVGLDRFLTDRSANDIITMTHLDIASRNTDRSTMNMFLGDRRPDGRYGSAISIDYGATADKFSKYHSFYDKYYIGMDDREAGRQEYIMKMCSVEDWYKKITPREFIARLDKVNVRDVARRIYETYGYEIDSRYLNFIEYSHKEFIDTTNDYLEKRT